MRFKDVIGLNETKSRLVDLVTHNRLSHALLFSGKEGNGALPLAIALANLVSLPQDPSNNFHDWRNQMPSTDEKKDSPKNAFGGTGQSWERADTWMDQHPAYPKLKKMIHPDIHFSYPVITRKAGGDPPISTDFIHDWREFILTYPYGNIYDWLQFIGADNKQGNITAHECDDIIRKLSLKSFESGYKILLVWMPEYLGNEGNRLLKLIEEPPANTLFILVTENESLILPTILSRTQLIRIPSLETNDVESALVERAQTPPEQARKIASVVEGNYREALQLIQHAGEDWENLFRDWLNAILKTGPIAQVKWVEEMSKLGRERQKQFLRYCNHLIEQAIRIRTLGESEPGNSISFAMPDNERDFAKRLNIIADIAQQQAIVQELDLAAYYIERNAHGKILFQALTIKLYHVLAHRQVAYIT